MIGPLTVLRWLAFWLGMLLSILALTLLVPWIFLASLIPEESWKNAWRRATTCLQQALLPQSHDRLPLRLHERPAHGRLSAL